MKVINHNLTEVQQETHDMIDTWNEGLMGNGPPQPTLKEEMNMTHGPNYGIQTGQCAVPGLSEVKYKMYIRSSEENAKRIEAENRK